MIGRGTRLHPDKADCVVLSLVNHSLDLTPITLQSFLDDRGWMDGQKLSDRKKKVAEDMEVQSEETEGTEERSYSFPTDLYRASALLSYLAQGGEYLEIVGRE